ncbi:hypothetical protein JCM9140_3758 [Halalkalibacter wakoensis JCM 9140]|uniref:Uncharacterized protein n=1 Tax=Halalkalibacter wakoensis JCM 9140 TaxID=1236970 RepID=W4Q6L8_9BACI|nr:hypothetical protein [Halalkalibacter wakoensis]GAE27605.1 hypothetical protein JCM9140_3758 [Halalkalibacter wakoensis JCM 9140]
MDDSDHLFGFSTTSQSTQHGGAAKLIDVPVTTGGCRSRIDIIRVVTGTFLWFG